MGNIVDISRFQPSNKIDWVTFSKNVDLLICRVQYGSSQPDCEYNNHIANAKQYNIPFNTYAFPEFVSVNDARVEARDCVSRTDKDSKFLWLDIESEYSNGQPVGITKLPQDVRLECIKAYVDELRKNGVQKVGAYIAHNIYEAWGINTIVGIFDAIWIPRYGSNNGQPQTKPAYPCDIWQYTSVGHIDGYSGNLDVSVLNSDKTLDYFTGIVNTITPVPTPTPIVQPKPVTPSKPTYTLPTGVYKQGARGEVVKQIQTTLNALYFKCGTVDGIWGAKTTDAIKRFQSVYCNPVDGIYGSKTRVAMLKQLNK